ncbi:hypothetical protein C1896_20625 [Pseudomonadaceae bacterium SI-3]|nr:hypothetical protein C1896_20625 [Pseudomonadaceae bacterium SI-3]
MMRLRFAVALSRYGKLPAFVGASLLAIRGNGQSIASKLAPTVNISAVGWASARHFNDGLDWLRRAAVCSMLKCCLTPPAWRDV